MLNSVLNGDWSNSVPGRKIPEGRSRATFLTFEILYISKNCYTSQGDPDSSFSLWLIPFGNCHPRTELLQTPVRTEFSMGSLSRRYRRSLQGHRQFLRSYCRSLRHCRDPCGVVAIPEAIGVGVVADSAMPIVLQLTKHREPLEKHHETLKTL